MSLIALSEHVCDQWHSSRESTALTVATINYVQTLKAWDRSDIALCGQQPSILEAALKPGKPLVTVLVNGGTISASWIKEHSTAVLEAWYPGQSGGEAVAAVVFGDRAPGGRMPVTVYDESMNADRNITDMSLRKTNRTTSAQGLTYMHYEGSPLWPFGFGLVRCSVSNRSLHSRVLSGVTMLLGLKPDHTCDPIACL